MNPNKMIKRDLKEQDGKKARKIKQTVILNKPDRIVTYTEKHTCDDNCRSYGCPNSEGRQ